MKKVSITTLLVILLSFASPFQVQATLPEKNIVFWGLGQSNEQKDNDLIKAYNLAKKGNYEQALKIINQKISAGTNLTYGGYNKLQWGGNIAYNLNNINANLQVYNLLGFAPKIGKSFGIQLKIQWLLF